ncbi:DUF4974 domain-containing protein [Aestuariibacter sp. GS-14]|uniref:FecR family protein n=1 Tax=Aestuariibacter sp. GS-14 TaxID=2590670 RepID=UPI00112ACCE9|nr:FecR domain-containing protein [Aestuariibacter sp. GS-14]TPV57743.1 DUF4974 domain-containing protein [Aestuariibacter sp. GS-14]
MAEHSSNNVVPLHGDDRILDEASRWLVKLDNGLSQQDVTALKLWLRTPVHQDTFLEVAALWDKMEVLSKLAEIVPAPRSQRSVMRPVAIAASFLCVALLGWLGLSAWQPPSQSIATVQFENALSTKVGEMRELILSDGSKLTLNTNTQVAVTYTDHQRLIELKQGELHIEVAKDNRRPLSVIADGQIIQAVGTAFNVEWVNNTLDLLVTEGRVRVAQQSAPITSLRESVDVRLPGNSLSVSQGHRTTLSEPVKTVRRVDEAELNAGVSWQTGKLIFRGESLADVVREVSRYTTLSIELGDASLANIQVAGLFNANDIDGLLAALADNFPLRYEHTSPHTVIIQSL